MNIHDSHGLAIYRQRIQREYDLYDELQQQQSQQQQSQKQQNQQNQHGKRISQSVRKTSSLRLEPIVFAVNHPVARSVKNVLEANAGATLVRELRDVFVKKALYELNHVKKLFIPLENEDRRMDKHAVRWWLNAQFQPHDALRNDSILFHTFVVVIQSQFGFAVSSVEFELLRQFLGIQATDSRARLNYPEAIHSITKGLIILHSSTVDEEKTSDPAHNFKFEWKDNREKAHATKKLVSKKKKESILEQM